MLSTWQIVTLFAEWLNQEQKAPTPCLGRGGWERDWERGYPAGNRGCCPGTAGTRQNPGDPCDFWAWCRQEWAGELTCQGTASWDSRLCLLQERSHIFLFFTHWIKVGGADCGTPAYFFPLFFLSVFHILIGFFQAWQNFCYKVLSSVL